MTKFFNLIALVSAIGALILLFVFFVIPPAADSTPTIIRDDGNWNTSPSPIENSICVEVTVTRDGVEYLCKEPV